MYQKADPASIKKIRRKCATVAPISPLRPPGEPSPTRQRGKNPKKYGANAPQLHPISYLSRTNPGKTKKYGANAPQLHAIRCSIDFCVMLCNEQAKKQKIRRKRATVAPYLSVANQPGNRPQLALPGAFCYTLVYSRINLFLLFRALPILLRQEKESNQWRPGGKEL